MTLTVYLSCDTCALHEDESGRGTVEREHGTDVSFGLLPWSGTGMEIFKFSER